MGLVATNVHKYLQYFSAFEGKSNYAVWIVFSETNKLVTHFALSDYQC